MTVAIFIDFETSLVMLYKDKISKNDVPKTWNRHIDFDPFSNLLFFSYFFQCPIRPRLGLGIFWEKTWWQLPPRSLDYRPAINPSIDLYRFNQNRSLSFFWHLLRPNWTIIRGRWVFVKCMKTVKSLFTKKNDVDFEFFRKFKASLRLD